MVQAGLCAGVEAQRKLEAYQQLKHTAGHGGLAQDEQPTTTKPSVVGQIDG